MQIGIDIVDISDIEMLNDSKYGLQKIFTTEELHLADKDGKYQKIESLAGRFAVKEASVKALGTGFSGGIQFKDIETLNSDNGKPLLNLYGKAKIIADQMGVVEYLVSISYSQHCAIALVILR